MTPTDYIDQFAKDVRVSATNLIEGDCLKRFKAMTSEEQQETAIKVALFVLGAILVSYVIEIILSGIILTAVVGLAAFAYFTSRDPGKGLAEMAPAFVRDYIDKGAEAVEQGTKFAQEKYQEYARERLIPNVITETSAPGTPQGVRNNATPLRPMTSGSSQGSERYMPAYQPHPKS